jgi:Protein of unknown function (DUF3618)
MGRSPEEIRSEIAETRNDITRTLTEIRHRVDPKQSIPRATKNVLGKVGHQGSVLVDTTASKAKAGGSTARSLAAREPWHLAVGSLLAGLGLGSLLRARCTLLGGSREDRVN